MLLAVMLGRGIMAMRQLVVVPIYLRYWGAEYYGEWLIISAIPSFLAMSNLGLGTAACNKVAIDVAADRIDQSRQTFSSVGIALLAMSFVVTFATFAFCRTLHFSSFREIESPGIITGLLVAMLLPRMIAGLTRGWWIGLGRAAYGNHLQNALSGLELVAILFLVLFGQGAVMVALTLAALNFAWLFVSLAVTQVYVSSRLHTSIFTSTLEWPVVVSMLRTGVGHQLSPLWQAVYFQGSILLAGALLGAEGAAGWGAIRIFIRSGSQLLELVSQSLSPEFQICVAEQNWERLDDLRRKGDLVCRCAATTAVALLLTAGLPVFHYWTHYEFSVPYLVWATTCLSLLPFSSWWTSSEVLRSLNQPWKLNLLLLAAASASLATSWLLAAFGLLALAIGVVAFDLLAVIGVRRIVETEALQQGCRSVT